MPKRPSKLQALWPFKSRKADSPGFGVREDFYLSVLAVKNPLPPVAHIVNPDGQGGAAVGFGVPLAGEKDKTRLVQPMSRGTYALASKDQKTVLTLVVIPKEEAGFNPAPLLESGAGKALPGEVVTRIKATWNLLQLTFKSYDPDVYPALDFLLRVAERSAELTGGVLADPISRVYKLPEEVRTPHDREVAAQDFVSTVPRESGDSLKVHTLGLQKFNLPELEIDEVPTALSQTASHLLLSLAQTRLSGQRLSAGDRIRTKPPFQLAEGVDRAYWGDVEVLEVIPVDSTTTAQALEEWSEPGT